MKEQIRCVPLRKLCGLCVKALMSCQTRKEKEIKPQGHKGIRKGTQARHFRQAFTVSYNTSSKFLGSLRRDNAETAAQGIHAPHGPKLCRYYSGRARSGALP